MRAKKSLYIAGGILAVKHRLKAMGSLSARRKKISDWQLIMLQSRANGCLAKLEKLPQTNWCWPKHTWFQDRLSRYLSTLRDPRSLASAQLGTPLADGKLSSMMTGPRRDLQARKDKIVEGA